MDRQLLYPGCLVLACLQSYELSAKTVMAALGVELEDMHGFMCCASSIVPSFSDGWINLAAYNLALAESRGLDIMTLCGSCTKTLVDAKRQLEDDRELLAAVNVTLARAGLCYSGGVTVRHIIQVLHERLPAIEAAARTAASLKVAVSPPCNVSRPGELMRYGDAWKPREMREIVQAAGVSVVDYDQEYECCGSALLMSDERLAVECARAKLKSATAAGAGAIVVACGNCAMLLEKFQHKISAGAPELKLPLMFLPQIVGRALGIADEELGLVSGIVKA